MIVIVLLVHVAPMNYICDIKKGSELYQISSRLIYSRLINSEWIAQRSSNAILFKKNIKLQRRLKGLMYPVLDAVLPHRHAGDPFKDLRAAVFAVAVFITDDKARIVGHHQMLFDHLNFFHGDVVRQRHPLFAEKCFPQRVIRNAEHPRYAVNSFNLFDIQIDE